LRKISAGGEIQVTTIKDALTGILGNVTDDEPKSPMHIGEVMNLWLYHGTLTEANRYVEIALNTTTDDELIVALKHSFEDCSKQVAKIEDLFKKEGISLPPTPTPKPRSNPDDVPLGVKLTDDEIANGLSLKVVSAITLCASGISQAIRSDIGTMWLNFLLARVKFGAMLNSLMRKRGWIKVPPYYYSSKRSE